ncbi:LamG domain-containing protein [Cerasicoccus maritimus]|uniref:LamG domain-containing protein n=1 Tax=Cerasicoccus maritimus TaxID=490089 RepID=UPI002852C28E|nr:LamG domain-containing protein [Cerasicoccus maritimus]
MFCLGETKNKIWRKIIMLKTGFIACMIFTGNLILAKPVAEWDFTNLPADEVILEVESSDGAPALRQSEFDYGPFTIRSGNVTSLKFNSEQRSSLYGSSDGPYDFGDGEAFAVEVSVYPTEYAPTEQTARQIIMKRARSGNYHGWSLAIDTNGRLVFVIAAEGMPAKVLKSRESIPLNEWSEVAIARRADGGMELYLDGDLITEGNGLTGSLKNDSELFVGRHSGAENKAYFFDGQMKSIRISTGKYRISK